MKRSHEDADIYNVRRSAIPGSHNLTSISASHQNAVIVGSHPASGLSGSHQLSGSHHLPTISGPHPPAGSHSTSASFSHQTHPPTPKQLTHNFEQMRDLTRPPFSGSHMPLPNVSNSSPPVNGSHSSLTQQSAHMPPKPSFQTHVQGPSHVAGGQQQYQRLKVEDALSYLDQVKLQFGNKPQVYNEFLDIMKEFKSQTIDTPGVISRVSALFKGHIDLIVGFNTFLPPGYKIEVSLTDINTVNVCAPTGTTTHLISGSGLIAAPNQPNLNKPPVVQSISHVSTLVSTAVTTTLPKSPTRPISLPSKSSSPVSSAPVMSLPSPGVHSQTQAQHHAINYVTKIKNRFQGQPEVYQKFLDILNNYQTEQKAIKENTVDQYGRVCQEQDIYAREGKLATEVYQQVAKLFNKQEDLLQEFSQFLPDATGSTFNPNMVSTVAAASVVTQYQPLSKGGKITTSAGNNATKILTVKTKKLGSQNNVKQEQMEIDKDSSDKNKKRHKSALKDVSLEEAVKHGSFSDFAFFDKVRKALKSQEVYENFLRCLTLFNNEVISRAELIQLSTTFLGKFPDLFNWFKAFLGYKDNQQPETNITGFKDRGTGGELAHLEIDFASCKRSGASYRALPKSYTQPKCSGRTQLCKDLLNDTWVSLPSWSEDTQFPGTRKTQYEEYIYKCEDERFELDIVVEANLSTIKVLEGVQKKLSRMNSDDQLKLRLDNCLGGTSEIIHRKAIYRIYGDKSPEIIDGLKKTPNVAIPVVLKRLKQKDEEWRIAQKQFNRIWRDQNEKYYLKSLDHQGINFKQNDLKAIRSKSIIQHIEMLYEERSDQIDEGSTELSGPHITFVYQDQSTLEDASSLIIHHMKRQTSIHKEDKTKIKAVLLHFCQNLFFAPRGELSDDEQEEISESKHISYQNDEYNLFFTNSAWFIMLRMHQMLCERLLKMNQLAAEAAAFELNDKKHRREGTAVALHLKKMPTADIEEYYPGFLVMVKNLLDGHTDSNSFEDSLREAFGVNSYIAFTIDKLIQNIVRQLHSLVTDDISMKLYALYEDERRNGAAGGSSITATARSGLELAYQKKVETLLSDENSYKIYFHKDNGTCKASIELLPNEGDLSEDQAEVEKWSEYVERFVGNSEVMSELKEHLCKKPIFLLRNSRVLQRFSKRQNKHKRKKRDECEDNDEPSESVSSSTSDVIMDNRLECKISQNTYKMRYVSGTRDLMFRRSTVGKSLKSHPSINMRLHSIYKTSHEAWLHENTTRDQCHQTELWFTGKDGSEDMMSCITTKDVFKHGGININKYSVIYTKDSKNGFKSA
ncbi:paired amphipathic helix protein Sin3a isoform X2 [Hydra vulgaris]|uniref:Paired amphipathic helix protein Sin3a isoform X2 n=1 Tax=Hydra vulgaris TaxID=6087 RepID=A0ABM4CIL4_HYDVU